MATSVAAWLPYDANVVECELAYAERLQLNSVRAFLSTVVYERLLQLARKWMTNP